MPEAGHLEISPETDARLCTELWDQSPGFYVAHTTFFTPNTESYLLNCYGPKDVAGCWGDTTRALWSLYGEPQGDEPQWCWLRNRVFSTFLSSLPGDTSYLLRRSGAPYDKTYTPRLERWLRHVFTHDGFEGLTWAVRIAFPEDLWPNLGGDNSPPPLASFEKFPENTSWVYEQILQRVIQT